VAPGDLVSRQVEAQAHPGLLVLKRPWDDKGKLKSVVTVDEVRRLGEFFGLKSASGGWRITLIDSADDMNLNAANALLKNLEEPPARSLLILISHAPAKLLPTIRSRVQHLDMKPLAETLVIEMLARMAPELDTDDQSLLARLSEGSLGLALRLAGEEGAQLAEDAERLLTTGSPDWTATLKLAERVGRRADDLKGFGNFLQRAVSRRVRAQAEAGHGDQRAVELCEQLNGLFTRAKDVNLDPRQTVLAAAALIATAHRHHVL
jgi:DNA polymerase-3 subunit delta'